MDRLIESIGHNEVGIMENFYVQVKSVETDDIVKELGPMNERKAVKVAAGMDINMSEDFYAEVVEKRTSNA